MAILSEMVEERPSTLPFTASFDSSNPLGFLEKVLDFIGKESNFLWKDTAEKEITTAVKATKERLREAEKKKKKEKEKERLMMTEPMENLQEVTVNIPVPSGSKSRSVTCEIKKNSLKVGFKGQDPIIDGEFFNAVKPDECFWNIEDQKVISVLLTKQDQMEWWKYCLKGEPEIDTQKVEPESSKLGDLDPDIRQSVEKMMFDQRQKQMGLPTSDEIEKKDMLKKFMAQHPGMDFSNAKFN
ncbi:CS domain [Arabidopsis thaliana x Arabidopsis arenosa]|uniref:CS domain n=1 Tax=Arabidopsis thaliana x Arabidopsis arenosa TaxID=1240361 RepID=A0A8T2C4G8_9BRAS|nr:CS domain [Arabidopsis thaliana x Arabidopsis arenosa]